MAGPNHVSRRNKLIRSLKTAGVDALLTVDIPPEEVEQVNSELHRVGMDNIFLVAPTTPPERRAHS